MEYKKYELILKPVTTTESDKAYRVSRVKEGIAFARDVLKLHEYPEEHMIVVLLDKQLNVIGYSETAKGTIGQVPVNVFEICRIALMSNANGIILFHNHPSGHCDPSSSDIIATKGVADACRTAGIELYDHFIVGPDGKGGIKGRNLKGKHPELWEYAVPVQAKRGQRKSVIYVCSPYSGDIEKNTERAKEYSKFVLENDMVPLTPHLMYPQFISEDKDREMVLSLDIALLERCDQIWVFKKEGEDLTEGMKLEMAMARLNNIYVRMVEPDLFESFRKKWRKEKRRKGGGSIKLIKPDELEALRSQYPTGTRVELLQMDDVQAPPIGTKGIVTGVDNTGSLMVSWDNGSGLNVIYGIDRVRKLN